MEILPGVHCIESVHKHRLLRSYLLVGEQVLLVDSGFPYTAEETILPYVDRVGVSVEQIDWLVITHASADHYGGSHAIKRRFPMAKIVAHELDADSIAQHDVFVREHVDVLEEYELAFSGVRSDDPEFLRLHGPETEVDWRVQGGEQLNLGDGWIVTFLHAAGHTPGHLILYDVRHEIVFAGDALMGDGIPDVNGKLVMPPHYFEVDWYLETIAKVRALNPQYILATHYESMTGSAVMRFLDLSEAFVVQCDRAVVDILESSREPLSSAAIVAALRDRVGIPGADYQYGLLARAHLRGLLRHGRVVLVSGEDGNTWSPVS